MSSQVLQQRLTPAGRAKIETAAQSLVRDVRSNGKLTAKQKRGIEDFLGPLAVAQRKSPVSGAFVSGRYWARTSDPQLVELVLSQLS